MVEVCSIKILKCNQFVLVGKSLQHFFSYDVSRKKWLWSRIALFFAYSCNLELMKSIMCDIRGGFMSFSRMNFSMNFVEIFFSSIKLIFQKIIRVRHQKCIFQNSTKGITKTLLYCCAFMLLLSQQLSLTLQTDL